ncbi:ras-related protein Rab-44 isoform 2-T2 [Cyanocitta cristata]
MEAQSSTSMELPAEVEADLQVSNEAGSPGVQQGAGVDPGVPLEDKPELGLGEEMGAAAVHREGPSPAQTPVGSPDLCELFPVKSQALEVVEADLQLCGGLSPETSQGGKGRRAIELQENEEEDGAQEQGEHGLPHEPEPHPSGVTLGQGEGAGAGLEPGEEAESLGSVEHQNSGANVQLIAEGDELRLTLGGSTEADLQLLGEAGSSGTEQGRSVDPDVQPPDQADREDVLEMEVEDAQSDLQLCGGLSPGVPWGGESRTAVQIKEDEEEDGAQGQGEGELPHEPVLDLQGSGVEHSEGADEDMQAQEEAESLDTIEDQSSGANVQLIAEGDELKSASGESTEADLQPLAEAGSPGAEQGGRLDPDVQPLDQVDKAELVEAEDAQEDMHLSEGLSSGVLQGGEIGTDVQIEEEEEDGAQGQGEHGLPHEPVLDLQGSGVEHSEGADEDMQAQEEAESLDTIEHQSTDANVQLIAEGDELRLTLGWSTEADLQLLGEAGSPGTEQGGRLDPDVQPPDQADREDVLEMEVEDAQSDLQLCGGLSSGVPRGGESRTAVQIKEDEEEDGAQGQGEGELPHEPVLDLQGSGVEHSEGADEDMQAQEEAESLDTIEEQSTDANVQLIAEGDELKSASGESTEADLQPLAEAGSPGAEQGGRLDPDVQPLDQVDKAELVEVEAEDAQADLQLCGGLSPGAPWGGEGGRAVQIEEDEEEDGAQEQGEHGLPHEPELHSSGVTLGQGEGAGAGLEPGEEAESLGSVEHQSSGANVQLIAEGDELRLTLGGSTEADLQLLGEAGSPGTEQGGSVDPDVQPLDQVDKAELVEVEAEDAQSDLQLCGGLSSGVPQGGEIGTDVWIEEEEDRAQGQGEGELPHEPVLDLQGSGVRQGEGADEDMQAQEEAESLGSVEHQSSGANVQLIAEGDELRLTLGWSTEADLQLLGEAGSSRTEQGGRLDPDVQPLDQVDKAELVEVEAEDAQEDMHLSEGLSSGVLQGGEIGTDVWIEEEEDGAQGQGEGELPHEPVLDLQGSGVRQGEGADENMQAQEEAESLDTIEDQSSGANVQLIAEGDELKSASGESTEADWQALNQTDSLGTEQGGRLDPNVQSLDQVDKAELVEVEAEDSWTDTQLCGGLSPEGPQGGGDHADVQLRDGAADWGQAQSGHELLQELVPHPSGVTMRQRRETDAGVQPVEEVVILPTVGDQSSGANVQLIAEGDELRLTLGESTEADLQLLGEAGSSGTEQGGRLDPNVQPLDQVDKAELVEVEAEDAQADLQLCGGLSPGAPWGGEGGRAVQIEEDEEEDGAQEQGEHGLPHEPEPHPSGVTLGQGEGAGAGLEPGEEAESLGSVEHQSSGANVQLTAEAQVQREHGLPQESALDPPGARGKQGEGAGAGVQPQEEAESLDTLEAQGTDTDVQLFTEQHESKAGSRGSTEADLTPLGVAGMWEGEQSWTPGLESGLGASPTANPQKGAAAAHVPPSTEAALCPEPVTAAEGPGLQAEPGAYVGPEGQILEVQELLPGERAPAEEKPLDGAHGLAVAQGERLEAGVRNVVKTQCLGLNQGHDDAVPALASLFSEVLLQINTLKLETMMQEDVLIPDVWRLCAPGQATPKELQEQVSAQGHEGRLLTVAPRPEGETAAAMEPEHRAARPAEPPKQEVSPASTLHITVPPEDAGNDQLGMVLRDNSLGQGQLLGEQSKDLSAGQQEKMQEFGQKVSQEGEPSLGAVTAGGAGGPRGCPKAPLDPDHLYNVLFVGDSHVGKTSFLYRLHADTFNPHLAATVGLDYQIKNLVVDNKRFALRLWDSAGQERYHSMTKQFFRKADGVVLMYDITSEYSFSDVRYWLSCIQEAAEDGVAVLLLGNKTDCAAQRQVPTKEGECLAKEHQLMFYECSAASGHNVLESMVSFVRLLKVREDELKNKAEEVPKAPQKKKGCCW